MKLTNEYLLSLLERVDIKDTIFLGDWGVPATESDLRYLWINDYSGLPTVLYKSYWNDNGAENADKNLGIDIMQYIYIDGVSVREIVTKNQLGETAYKGVTEPLNHGKVFAPVVVVTDINGIAIKVLTEYKTSFFLTFKAGFSIVSNDVIYYVSEDVSFMVYEKNDTLSQGPPLRHICIRTPPRVRGCCPYLPKEPMRIFARGESSSSTMVLSSPLRLAFKASSARMNS